MAKERDRSSKRTANISKTASEMGSKSWKKRAHQIQCTGAGEQRISQPQMVHTKDKADMNNGDAKSRASPTIHDDPIDVHAASGGPVTIIEYKEQTCTKDQLVTILHRMEKEMHIARDARYAKLKLELGKLKRVTKYLAQEVRNSAHLIEQQRGEIEQLIAENEKLRCQLFPKTKADRCAIEETVNEFTQDISEPVSGSCNSISKESVTKQRAKPNSTHLIEQQSAEIKQLSAEKEKPRYHLFPTTKGDDRASEETVNEVAQEISEVSSGFYNSINKKSVTKQRAKPNSIARGVKEKERKKKLRDDAFEYSINKRRKCGNLIVSNKDDYLNAVKQSYRKSCADLLSDACLTLILNASQEEGKALRYEKESFIYISFEDIDNVIRGNYISSSVVGAYSIELMRRTDIDGKSTILAPTFYRDVMNAENPRKHSYIHAFFDAMLEEKTIFIPICSNGQGPDATTNHWTLLVFDSINGRWWFYNSLPRKKDVTDCYYNDVLLLKKRIEASIVPLEMELTQVDFNHPISSVDLLPNQGLTYDCAVYVCYYMTELVYHRAIKKTWAKEAVRRFKAMMIETIVMCQ